MPLLRKWPVSVKVILGQVRSRFGKKSRKTTFSIMRTCPFHSVLVVAFGFRILCRAILNSTLATVLSDFSIVYLIFSRAIKPGAFSDIKTLWIVYLKELCRLAYQGRVFGILYLCICLFSYAYFFTIDCIYLFDIFGLLVSHGSWLYFRFNQWIIIPEREDVLLIACSGRTCSRSPASPATSTGPPRTRTSSRVTSRSDPLFGPLTLRRIYHAAAHQIQVGLTLLIILIVCFDPALR